MAAILVNSDGDDYGFERLKSNPMFDALRESLLSDVQQNPDLPSSLMKSENDELPNADLLIDPNIAAVQEANLMSDFQQALPSGNVKVIELRDFYSTQCSNIENERNRAIERLKENNMLSLVQYQREMNRIHIDFDQQRMHLTNRVTASLQLLKMSIPSNEVSSSKPKGRQLNAYAVEIMTDWFERHIDSPYPTDEEKQELADLGGLTMSQVKAWFANKRNRTNNTKPKKQKQQVEKRLLSICTELSSDSGSQRPRLYGDIIEQLNDLVNSAPAFTRLGVRLSDSYNSSGDEFDMVHCD